MNRTTTAASRGNQQSIVNASAPKERPILFSAPMVKALLEGRKTQTRRIVKGSEDVEGWTELERLPPIYRGWWSNEDDTAHASMDLDCLYGNVGERLWVREAFWVRQWGNTFDGVGVDYKAGGDPKHLSKRPEKVGRMCRWMPSIHMPRWASRITLEIAEVRVERLQDISRGDCMAEGCPFPNIAKLTDPIEWFAELWESINENWDANPWVWVVEFKRI